VLNVEIPTSQSGDQVDLSMVQEIIVPTGEAGMGLLLDLEDNIASKDTRGLVTLAAELNLGAALDATIDMDVKDLAIDNGLLAEALLAAILVLNNLTLAIAVRADCLEALDHRTHLTHHGLHAMAVAARAFPNSAFLAAATLAFGTDDGPLQSQLGHLSAVDVLEGNLVNVVDGLGLRGSAGLVHAAKHATETAAEAGAAEELGEEILSRHTAAAASPTFQAGFAILIVYLALLGVGKNLVGMGDLFELLLRRRVVVVFVCA
jgi:hypothetical protein